LNALLGPERVGTPILKDTHRPDAFHMESFLWAVESAVPSGQNRHSRSDSHALKPAHTTAALRRFRPAAPATVLLDENKPAHVRSSDVGDKVVRQRGPYLISGNWWDEKSWARAEWDLQLENDELVRAHETEEKWVIDGIYD
jgi:protein ImuB